MKARPIGFDGKPAGLPVRKGVQYKTWSEMAGVLYLYCIPAYFYCNKGKGTHLLKLRHSFGAGNVPRLDWNVLSRVRWQLKRIYSEPGVSKV